jgi:DNA polymerase
MESKETIADCEHCTLRNEPFVPPWNVPDAEVIVVGEAPGREEVIQRKPFVGQSGKLLDAIIVHAGHDPALVHRTNVVLCRPPGNRPPYPEEIECCRRRLRAELLTSKCEVVAALGATAIAVLLNLGKVTQVRGVWRV